MPMMPTKSDGFFMEKLSLKTSSQNAVPCDFHGSGWHIYLTVQSADLSLEDGCKSMQPSSKFLENLNKPPLDDQPSIFFLGGG
jgi:hypothetical protein